MLNDRIEIIRQLAPQVPVIDLDDGADVHAGNTQQICNITCPITCCCTQVPSGLK